MQVFTHIEGLVQARTNLPEAPMRGEALGKVPIIRGAWLAVANGRIHSFGEMEDCPDLPDAIYTKLERSYVLPAWVDSHTHLIHAASRENEFVQRIRGLSYQEIAAAGGGILNSARKLRELSEEALFEGAMARLSRLKQLGTGCIEIKSGYGLSAESELKILRVAKRIASESHLPVKISFLGAHALPDEYKHDRRAYLNMLTQGLLPTISTDKLADYVDIFCEKNFFTAEEAHEMMVAGEAYGLRAKIHTNQFTSMGGIEAAIDANALSVDHLEVMTADEIKRLAESDVIGCLLPTAPFFLQDPYPPARELIDAGAAIAIASDFNPGSSPSGNMNFVLSLACIALRMTPEEAINAATINAAFALELQNEVGCIHPGHRANFMVTKPMSSLHYLPYAFGENCIQSVWISGNEL